MTPPRARRLQNIQEYFNSVRRLKQQSSEQGMLDKEFMNLYEKTLDSLTKSTSVPPQENSSFMKHKKYASLLVLSLTLIIAAVNYQSIYSCIASDLQDYIYPGLRLLRTLFIPIITFFNTLTEVYQELCILQNPFFTVADMDCWPCTLNNVIEVHDPEPVNEQYIPPYIYKTEQEDITLDKLKHFYMSHQNVLDKEAPRILSDNKVYIHPSDMIRQQESGENHNYIWKINRVNIARTFRKIIPRPQIVPIFGQSTEKYLIVDTLQEKFKIPDTECNFSFLLSLSGSRMIELKPAQECKHQCQPLEIELKQSYLLWYNFWYWKPIVQPSTANTTYIAHVGSYC